MTRYDDDAQGTSTTSPACDCEACRSGDLPVNPFVALRVAYGMLLGEEDFRVQMGNPRGKQMLHSSWLHGSGVVWGYKVGTHGLWDVTIGPGLAIDGIGRELLNEATVCLDVRDNIKSTQEKDDKDCVNRTVQLCLVAEFDSCLSAPVPTLADPCDVTRKHDDYSRVIERVRFSLRPDCCPDPCRPYHRVRVLLGLDDVGPDDEAGAEAEAARRQVAAAPPHCRAQALVEQFRRLAALDSIDRHPARESGDCYPTLFPTTEEDAGVALACVEVDVRERDGCLEIVEVRVDPHVRTALLPTATIQELACGFAPGLIGEDSAVDAGGPRVIGERITLGDDDRRRLVIPVTAALAPASVFQGSVGVTSLSSERESSWVVHEVYNARFDADAQALVVNLSDSPGKYLVRIIVKGSGPRPVLGIDTVPLAGLVGGPPGSKRDGHDAVWVLADTVPADDDAGGGVAEPVDREPVQGEPDREPVQDKPDREPLEERSGRDKEVGR